LPALKSRLPNTTIELARLGEYAPLIGAANLFKPVEKTVASVKKLKINDQ
jgi:glucokinase